MNKTKIISLIMILSIFLSTTCFASNGKETKTIERQETISVEDVNDYKNSISDELVLDNINYKLVNIEQTENAKILTKNKEITEELIVTTNDKYNVLNLFENTKQIDEDGYTGRLQLQNKSLEIKVNESYKEEYKVYMEKSYTNVLSNELNNIPKEIKENGIIYYLVNPVWNVADTEKVGDNDVATAYNGTMHYEGIKVKTIIRNYKATVKYSGILEKEVVESVKFDLRYEELPKETDYTAHIIATTSGIIVFSGILIIKSKNVKIYSYDQNDKSKLIKRIHINKKHSDIDVTPIKVRSNKYRIELSNSIYKEIKDTNIKIKYFDRQFIYLVKDRKFEINM